MNNAIKPIGPRLRILSAGFAALATAGVAGTVLGLAVHYDDEFVQVARARAPAGMQHALAAAQAPGKRAAGPAPARA